MAKLLTGASLFAQNEFITKWDTRLSGAANATIQFGAIGYRFTLSYAEQGGNGYRN